MTDKVESTVNSTKEVLSKVTESQFWDTLMKYSEEITKTVIEKTPEAYQALLQLIQFKFGFEVIVSGIITICIWLLIYKSIKLGIKYRASLDSEAMFPVVVFTFMVIVALFMVSLDYFTDLLQFTNWLGFLFPEGYLAMKALEAVGLNLL